MAESESTVEKKVARLKAAAAVAKQFINDGGDLNSLEALPLSVEFLRAFDDLARESGYEILRSLDQNESARQPQQFAPESKERKMQDILNLFTFKKKRELEKYARELVIDSSAFANVIYACEFGTLPLLHRIHYRDHVPDQLRLSEKDHAAITANGVGTLSPEASKAIGKITQIFRDRRYLVGHIFYTPDLSEWHFFQFDQRDLEDSGNHWKEGAHVHFLNWLWPKFDAETLWQNFTTGRAKMASSLHVRYFDAARSRRTQDPGNRVF